MTPVVFRNGSIFDGARHHAGRAVVVEGDRILAVVDEAGLDVRRSDRGRRPGRRAAAARLPGRPRPPGPGRARAGPLRPVRRRRTREEYLADRRGVRRRAPDAAVDHRRRLGDGGVPRRHPDRRPTSTRWSRTGPVFLPNRDHHGAWVNTRALELRRHRPGARPTPPTAGSSATPTATRPAPSTRARWRWSSRLLPRRPRTTRLAGAARGPARTCTRSGVTAWQDAILGAYAGMTDGAAPTCAAVDRGELTARVVGALWWDRERGVEQVAELVERRERLQPRAVPRRHGEDHAGRRRRELHRRHARRPTSTGAAAPPTTAATRFVEPDALREARHRAGRATASRSTSTRIGDRAVREALDAVEAARAANGPATPAPHRAPAGRAPRRRAALRRARRRRQHAGAVGRLRRPQMTELTLPFLGPERAALAVPVRRPGRAPARPWPRAATGRSAPRTRWPRSTSRSTAGRTATRARPARSRSCPSRRSTSAAAFAAYTAGSA